MTLKVIGAGFGRTGTLSLKTALETLGFNKCYHMFEVMQNPHHLAEWTKANQGESVDWPALFAGYQAAVDWPSCNFYRQQMAAFPDAKVLLSLRDPESWYKSIMNTIYPSTLAATEAEDERARLFGQWGMDIIWNRVFDNRMDEPQHVMDTFAAHNEAVQREVPADRLLVFEAKQGWEPLCAFLDVPVPDQPYPRTNTTEDFQSAMRTGGRSST